MVQAGGVVSLGWGWQPPNLQAPGGAPAGRIKKRQSRASTRELRCRRRRNQGGVPRELCVVCGVWVDLAQRG